MASKTTALLFIFWLVLCSSASYFGSFNWNERNILRESDFRVKVASVGNKIAEAYTSVNPIISTPSYSSIIDYCILAQFNKDSSWMHKRALGDGLTLQHEQGHFDICEINARALRKEMQLFNFSKNDYREEVDKLVSDMYLNLKSMQDLYDANCGYGSDKVPQLVWNNKIAKALDSLKNYSEVSGTRIIR